MLIINSNGSKSFGQESDTIEELKEALKNNTLDPVFEQCGNFVDRSPKWDNPEYNERFKGCTTIFGNFLTLSHVFNIITDDEQLISEIEELVTENKKRPEYQAAKIKRSSKYRFELTPASDSDADAFEFNKIREHVGHNIEVALYGDGVNVSVECIDCHEVIYSVDNPAMAGN